MISEPGMLRHAKAAAMFLLVIAVTIATSGWAAEGKTEPQKIPFPKPDSHKGNWIEYHGRTVPLTGNTAEVSGRACLVCHERNDCVSCHNTRLPRDHTNFWRTRGHGLTAGANPERCAACHRQDYCVRCHNETAPRTHVANWTTRHCTWCHFDGGVTPADNCVVCHKQAPHTSAPSLHAPIGAQTNCIQPGCHQ